MKAISINNKEISKKSPIYFIGEIGINHNGSVEIAKKLIDLASIFGIDAVKFQKRTPEICVPEYQKNIIRDTPWGKMTYFEYKKKIEFGEKEYKEIDRYCKEKNITWFASPWDIESVDFLEKFNVPCYKIASALLTNKNLLQKIKDVNKPIFLSTGMSTEKEIDKAVKILKESDMVLMHCNSSYPAKNDELNLRYIKVLQKKYPNLIIGYSGHENGIAASIVAGTLGAQVIERHITLDRSMWGTDHSSSLELDGFRRLSRDLKQIHIWIGDGKKVITEEEDKIKSKLRRVSNIL